MNKDIATIRPVLLTQGTTASPSRVALMALDLAGNIVPCDFAARLRMCAADTMATLVATETAALAAVTGGSAILEAHSTDVDLTFGGVAATRATGVLTLSGATANAKHVTVGALDYYFTSTNTLAALNTQVVNQRTKYLGGTTATADATLAFLKSMIENDPAAQVTPEIDTDADTLTVSAKEIGLKGNLIALGGNLGSWSDDHLTGGYDATSGILLIDVTRSVAGEFTLFVGKPTFRGVGANCFTSLSITHAAA